LIATSTRRSGSFLPAADVGPLADLGEHLFRMHPAERVDGRVCPADAIELHPYGTRRRERHEGIDEAATDRLEQIPR
jgi:hypothetical protein